MSDETEIAFWERHPGVGRALSVGAFALANLTTAVAALRSDEWRIYFGITAALSFAAAFFTVESRASSAMKSLRALRKTVEDDAEARRESPAPAISAVELQRLRDAVVVEVKQRAREAVAEKLLDLASQNESDQARLRQRRVHAFQTALTHAAAMGKNWANDWGDVRSVEDRWTRSVLDLSRFLSPRGAKELSDAATRNGTYAAKGGRFLDRATGVSSMASTLHEALLADGIDPAAIIWVDPGPHAPR
ncbi:MAG: hypothetical protein ABL886_01975 [Rhodoglobus sp.]